MPRGKKRIIHSTDPEYLETFYRLFGSGQSTTVRQEVQDAQAKEATGTPDAPKKGTQKKSEKA
jgi:hypothetical protein